ncbi:MAG: MoxR family ATPase [candidate division WOR-3 bacterium]
MNPKELKEVIKIHFEKKIPLLIFGHPGIGKSQITRETARELNVQFIDIRLSLLDPTDLRGFPYIDKERNITRWAIPEFLPNDDANGGGILMLDEINLAPPAVQNASYQLILDRQLGEYKLPKSWSIVAAGNILLKEGYITQIRSALISRFSVVELDTPSASDWIKDYAIPRGIDTRIIAYLYVRPDAIYIEPLDKNKNFPNPRNWENLSWLIKGVSEDDPVFRQLLISRLGPGIASEFHTFTKINISYEDWLDENRNPVLPIELDRKCFLLSALGSVKERVKGLCRLIIALQKAQDLELAALGVHILHRLLPENEIMKLDYWKEIAKVFGKQFIL